MEERDWRLAQMGRRAKQRFATLMEAQHHDSESHKIHKFSRSISGQCPDL